MQKLITYLKQGKGRGLRAMLIFSVVVALLSWALNYSTLTQYTQMGIIPASKMIWVHLGVIVVSFAFTWLLYGIVAGISTLVALAFKLKLPKGLILKTTFVSIASLFCLSLVFTLIAYVLAKLGEIALLFYPVIIVVLIPVLLVTLAASGLAEPKEGKKKK